MFTEYIFDKEVVKAETETFTANLKANKGTDDLAGFAVPMLANWLESRPLRYRDFGPYWWAFKKLLIARGLARGETMDEEVAAVYHGDTDAETVAMCQLFMDMYRARFVIGTNTFTLDSESATDYRLYDPDYEVSAAA